jgi:hypothetical protein
MGLFMSNGNNCEGLSGQEREACLSALSGMAPMRGRGGVRGRPQTTAPVTRSGTGSNTYQPPGSWSEFVYTEGPEAGHRYPGYSWVPKGQLTQSGPQMQYNPGNWGAYQGYGPGEYRPYMSPVANQQNPLGLTQDELVELYGSNMCDMGGGGAYSCGVQYPELYAACGQGGPCGDEWSPGYYYGQAGSNWLTNLWSSATGNF